jgi:polyphosphate kinase 2
MKTIFDTVNLEDPHLPKRIEKSALGSGGYPYAEKLDKDEYEHTLEALQIELVKLQSYLAESGRRVAVVFEGRDAAGKGGTIRRYLANLNPRHNRTVALIKPTETERSQWYFQRYIETLPAGGEQVLYDRSWYNRAVVEPVMGFCSIEQSLHFLGEAPKFERMLVDDGILLVKLWLNIGRAEQIKRFHERRHNPLKVWKLSPVDLGSLGKWEQYTEARNRMLAATHTDFAPWTVIRANDKHRLRLNAIRMVLSQIDYPGRKVALVTDIDESIVRSAPTFLETCGVDE